MPNHEALHCFTEFNCLYTETTYRAHPHYMGKPWYDYAMTNWHNYTDPIPAQIHTFVDLNSMAQHKSINIPGRQRNLGRGLYAVVETFRKKANDDDDADDEYSNTLIGRFVRDEVDGEPTLYLCHVTGLVGPLSGIPDIVRNNANNKPQRTYTSNTKGVPLSDEAAIRVARVLEFCNQEHNTTTWRQA
jgi:hypothetical protein